MEEKIFNLLRSLGFSKNETIVYLDLIGCNESSAREISHRTKLHRANTYESLKRLIETGFVSEIVKENNKRLFQAENPRKLKDYIKQKNQEIDEVLPMINSVLKSDNSQKDKIILTKGLFSTRNTIFSLMEHKSPIEIYGMPSNVFETLGEGFLNDFNKQRIKKKIPLRLIFNQNFLEYLSKLNKLQHTEARFSDLLIPSFSIVFICADTVLLSLVSKTISTIEIRNKEIADSYRGHFGILWENAKNQTSVN